MKGITKAILAGSVLAVAGAAVAYDLMRPNRQQIFEGKLAGWDVTYSEGKDSNHLSAVRKGSAIEYTDNEDAKSLDWDSNAIWDTVKNKPKPNTGRLELVVFTDKKGTLKFSRADIDGSTYSARNKEEVFTSADAHYDAFRNAIILAKRGESDEELSRYLEGIKDN